MLSYSKHETQSFQICQINASDWGSADKDQALLKCLSLATPRDLVAYDFVSYFHYLDVQSNTAAHVEN